MALLAVACGDAPEAASDPAPAPDDALAALAAPADPTAARPRDVVLVVVDTLRADHLGAYGHHRDTSPFLDGLAEEGTLALHAASQSSWTGPSMVSLFTARFLRHAFVQLPSGALTWVERLAAAGFQTHALQLNTLLAEGAGFEQGFDSYALIHAHDDAARADAYLAGVLRRAARTPERPLFLYVHFVDPHSPYEPKPEHDLFAPEPLPDARRDDWLAYLRALHPERDEASLRAEVEARGRELMQHRARYEGEVRQVDARVAALVRLLREAGRWDDTLFVLAADHGEGFSQHLLPTSRLAEKPRAEREDLLTAFKLTHHTLVYETMLHVPLLFVGPGVPRGRRLDELVNNVDIGPTILDLLGLPPLPGAHGRSLVPSFAGASPPAVRQLQFANTHHATAVRDAAGRKLIVPWTLDGVDPIEFYDLAADADERAPLPLGGDAYRRLAEQVQRYRAQPDLPTDDAAQFLGDDTARELDAETLERLRALGYLGDLGVDAAPAPDPAPAATPGTAPDDDG